MGKMSFSSIVELEKKKREELLCVERKALGGEGRGGEGREDRGVRWRRRWGRQGRMAQQLHIHDTHTRLRMDRP
jgi:hypothetical protein